MIRDTVYEKLDNSSPSDKIESLQYYAALAITGAIRGLSKENMY